MYTLALAHLKDHESITKGLPAFERAYTAARATLDAIDAAENLRGQKLQAITAGKRQYLDEIGHQAQTVASAIVNYAVEKNNAELKKAMGFSYTDFFYVPVKKLGTKVSIILETAKTLTGELKDYGVSDEMLGRFTTQAEQFIDTVNRPRSTQAEKKEAGQQVKDNLNLLKDQLKNQLDGLMLQFKYSHPEFYNQYFEKRNIVNAARRSTRVEGVVIAMASREGLGNATITVKETGERTVTNADGSYSLVVPPQKGVVLVYEKEGYATVTVTVDTRRGQALQQQVELQQQ